MHSSKDKIFLVIQVPFGWSSSTYGHLPLYIVGDKCRHAGGMVKNISLRKTRKRPHGIIFQARLEFLSYANP